jgi:hypothetical protein
VTEKANKGWEPKDAAPRDQRAGAGGGGSSGSSSRWVEPLEAAIKTLEDFPSAVALMSGADLDRILGLADRLVGVVLRAREEPTVATARVG